MSLENINDVGGIPPGPRKVQSSGDTNEGDVEKYDTNFQ